MKQVASNGTVYERHRRGRDGPTVALVHGLGLNRAMWQWQLPALTADFDVVTYDLWGHGESPDPPGSPSLEMFSHQLAQLLDDIGVERAAVAGFSLGGMIARRFAYDCPGRLTALAILNSAHDRKPAEREAILGRVEQARQSGPAATVDAALDRWFTPDFRAAHRETIDLVRQWVTANDTPVYPEIYRVFAEGDAEIIETIRGIGCPTLVMTGEDDNGNTPDMTRRMAAAIPGARSVVLPGLRHMALAEAPEQFNAPLMSFLHDALAV